MNSLSLDQIPSGRNSSSDLRSALQLCNASLVLYCSEFPAFTLCRAGSKGLGFIKAPAHFSHHLGISSSQHLGTKHAAIEAWSPGGRMSYSVPGLGIPKLPVQIWVKENEVEKSSDKRPSSSSCSWLAEKVDVIKGFMCRNE